MPALETSPQTFLRPKTQRRALFSGGPDRIPARAHGEPEETRRNSQRRRKAVAVPVTKSTSVERPEACAHRVEAERRRARQPDVVRSPPGDAEGAVVRAARERSPRRTVEALR